MAGLATTVGMGRQTLYAIEAGSYVPNTAGALRLERALQVRVEDLFALPESSQRRTFSPTTSRFCRVPARPRQAARPGVQIYHDGNFGSPSRSPGAIRACPCSLATCNRPVLSCSSCIETIPRALAPQAGLRPYCRYASERRGERRIKYAGDRPDLPEECGCRDFICCFGGPTRKKARVAVSCWIHMFGLDFMPLVTARYDLVMRRQHLDLPSIQALLDTLSQSRFRKGWRGLAVTIPAYRVNECFIGRNPPVCSGPAT